MNENKLPSYEKTILDQIRDIESRIREQEEEKAALRRLLAKARQNSHNIPNTARKNSISRIAIERLVIEILKETSKQVATLDKLYKEAKRLDSNLKNGAFRTYINRMKEKKIIERAGWGAWRLKNNNSS